MKKIWISCALCATILLMAGCSSSKTPVQQTTPQASTQKSATVAAKGDLTLEELKKYDGQNGNPAYVAVDGTIYDVTNAKGWNNGKHKNGITAGNDLTAAIDSAPHGRDVLANLTVVGKIK
jgi:predicted heme/steroid binding protein